MERPDARRIVRVLKGRWAGHSGSARCPAHEDKSPSLNVTQKGDVVLVHCHAGCDQRSVIEALQDLGLWPHREERAHPSYPTRTATLPRHDEAADADERRRTERARQIWREAQKPAAGTLVETYLRARGIRLAVPASLAFAPHLRHGGGAMGPALVAAIQDGEGHIVAVQRTWLLPDGSGKAALDPPKATLGPMKDGALRLAHAGETLGLAEGLETALSAMQLFMLPVWATLGAARMKHVKLPAHVKRVVLFRDPGERGKAAAYEACTAFALEGRHMIVQDPPEGDDAKTDWNDWVRREVA